ncbi:MAG: hypothetical protein L6R42_000430, partial [Xanthoria sp. 1 TBL-2021]
MTLDAANEKVDMAQQKDIYNVEEGYDTSNKTKAFHEDDHVPNSLADNKSAASQRRGDDVYAPKIPMTTSQGLTKLPASDA